MTAEAPQSQNPINERIYLLSHLLDIITLRHFVLLLSAGWQMQSLRLSFGGGCCSVLQFIQYFIYSFWHRLCPFQKLHNSIIKCCSLMLILFRCWFSNRIFCYCVHSCHHGPRQARWTRRSLPIRAGSSHLQHLLPHTRTSQSSWIQSQTYATEHGTSSCSRNQSSGCRALLLIIEMSNQWRHKRSHA